MSSELNAIKNLHALESVLELMPHTLIKIECGINEQFDRSIDDFLQKQQIPVIRSKSLSGWVAYCRPLELKADEWLTSFVKNDQSSKVLILDGITDPHNLGACMRSAAVFGIDAIIIGRHHTVKLTEVVRNVACGGAERVPLVQVKNVARSLDVLKENGYWVYGACESGEHNLENLDFPSKTALMMGAEGRGIKKILKSKCDHIFAISTQDKFACLNVSVATGICLHQMHRQLAKY